jgi:hypothetical protein
MDEDLEVLEHLCPPHDEQFRELYEGFEESTNDQEK